MSQSSQQESSTAQTSTSSPEDDWSSVKDPNERRKIQNRIAQRKFSAFEQSSWHTQGLQRLTYLQERKHGNSGKRTNEPPRTSAGPAPRTPHPSRRRSTMSTARACRGAASRCGTSSRRADRRSRVRGNRRSTRPCPRPAAARGKLARAFVPCKWRLLRRSAVVVGCGLVVLIMCVRVGLHLIDQYARGNPAWAAWKARFAGIATGHTARMGMQWRSTPG